MPRTRLGSAAAQTTQDEENEDDDKNKDTGGETGTRQGKKIGFTPVTGKVKGKYLCRGGANVCGLPLSDKEDCIMCDACDNWFHPGCQGLSIEAFGALSKYDFMWLCLECRPRLRSMIDLGKTIESRVEHAEKRYSVP